LRQIGEKLFGTQDLLIHHLQRSVKNSLCMHSFQSFHMYFNTNIYMSVSWF